MITALLSIGLALLYLLYETDWLRIRLLIGDMFEGGACCEWHLPNSAVTEDMRDELIRITRNGRHGVGEFVDWLAPLCGWGYAYQYRNFKPPVSLQLVTEHSRITITNCTDTKALNEVIKAYKNPLPKQTMKRIKMARLSLAP